MRHYVRLIFVFLVEMEFDYVGQAGLELLTSGNPTASASLKAGITDRISLLLPRLERMAQSWLTVTSISGSSDSPPSVPE
ncbi:hypothetical protein AAY473_001247 [Plecturocebus cupreus]